MKVGSHVLFDLVCILLLGLWYSVQIGGQDGFEHLFPSSILYRYRATWINARARIAVVSEPSQDLDDRHLLAESGSGKGCTGGCAD